MPAAYLKPVGAGSDGKHPVIQYHYGGPASQVVADSWGTRGRNLWHTVTVSATLDEPLSSKPGRATFHLCEVSRVDGEPRVRPVRSTGSGDVLAMARANGFLVAGAEGGDYLPGARVPVMLWKDSCPV